jgi:sulfur carrier protein
VQPEVISISVNGEVREVTANQTVAGLLQLLELPAERVAVEMNRALVRKRDWQNVTVLAGAQLEIVEFVGGG